MRNVKLGCNKIVYGEDAVQALADLPADRKRAYIVMSGTINKDLGQLKMVTDILEGAGFQCRCNFDVEPEPSWKTIQRGTEDMREFEPDWIIGFGGGSAMDAAKAMWVFYENPQYTTIEETLPPNTIENLGVKAHVCCIPTSAGTGSEASRAALIKDTELHKKFSIRDMNNRMTPSVAIIDPVFATTMPKGLTAGSGMDALTHAIESYVTPGHNVFSDACAMGSWVAGYKNLATCYAEPDNLSARAEMLASSTLGAIAFSNAGLGIVHSIAHTFGALYGVPHGLANAVVLPYGIEFNAANDTDVKYRYDELARFVGKDDLYDTIVELRALLEVPDNMKAIVGDEEAVMGNLDHIVETALGDMTFAFNPVKATQEQMRELIIKVYSGSTR